MSTLNFITSEGHTCQCATQGVLTCSDLNWIADWYCQHHPDKLPTHVWLHPSLYKDFAAVLGKPVVAFEDGQPCLMITTGAGILLVKPVPYGFNKFLLLLGTKEDYNHYFVDEIFEETVLSGCERE